MRNVRLTGIPLSISIAASLLSGCGGSQPPIGALSYALPQTPSSHARRASGSYGDLLYFTSESYGAYIYTFPGLSQVAQFDQDSAPQGICVDSQQNVYIGSGYGIQEFAHGGTTPVATFGSFYGDYNLTGCSVDPTTGNFAAVAEGQGVYIWQNRSGTPTFYYKSQFRPFACAYDSAGDLFLSGYNSLGGSNVIELPDGGSSFEDLSLDKAIPDALTIQWLGTYLVVSASNHKFQKLYKITVAGSTGTVRELPAHRFAYQGFVIEGNTALIPYKPSSNGLGSDIAVYRYPRGKSPTNIISVNGKYTEIEGMVISAGSR